SQGSSTTSDPSSSSPVSVSVATLTKILTNAPAPSSPSQTQNGAASSLKVAISTKALALSFQLTIEPWETDRPAPGDTIFFNMIIEPGDPRVVDIIVFNGALGNHTIIFEDDRLLRTGDEDATGFDLPHFPPGTQYTGRLGRPKTQGREILAESRPFEIFPAGTKPSTATSTGTRLWSLLIFVTLFSSPASAEFTIEVIDTNKGSLFPGSKLDYLITSGDDPTDVDLHLYNLDTQFSALVEPGVAPEQNGTFMGHFRIGLETPPRSQSYLAFSKAFAIFAPLPDPSNPPPPTSAPPSASQTHSSPNSPPTTTITTQLPPASTTRLTTSGRTSATSTLPSTRSTPNLPTARPPSASSGASSSSASASTTRSSDITNVPAPTSSGRTPLDAGQDTQPRAIETQVNVPAIVGTTVGVVVAVGIALWIFLCWRRFKRKSKGIPQPFPFLIVPPLRVLPSPSAGAQQPSPQQTSSLSTIPESLIEPYFDDTERHAEFLRRERDRIDNQLAELERNKLRQGSSSKRSAFSAVASSSASTTTSPSSSNGSSAGPSDLLEELNMMREKVRRLEAARDANPPPFDENPSPSQSSSFGLDPARRPSALDSKSALRSQPHSFHLYRLVSIGVLIIPAHGYTITVTTPSNNRPRPGDNLFYDITRGPSDTVTIVDIHLADGNRGNSSLIFGSSDLTKSTDASAGFPIPGVPPGSAYTIRLLDASNKNRLADSATFQIFAIDSPSGSSLPPATLPPAASTSTPTQSPTTAPSETVTASKKSTPIGPIIGGVLGGLLAIVLILLALLLLGRRKKRRLSYYESNNKPRPITPPPNGEVKPFTVRPSEPPTDIDGTESTTNLTYTASTRTATTGARTTMSEKARLAQAQAQARFRPVQDIHSQPNAPSSPTGSAAARAEELRMERDRLNRLIADLENRTVSSPSTFGSASTYTFASSSNQTGVSSGDSRDHHLAEQVAALREQIQRMEARQTQHTSQQQFSSATSNAGFTDYEPPPGYEPPPSSNATAVHPASPRASTMVARASGVDRKDMPE
ncbi:hypothetical protein CVT24_008057, partial [Panaeolus cyanescens]